MNRYQAMRRFGWRVTFMLIGAALSYVWNNQHAEHSFPFFRVSTLPKERTVFMDPQLNYTCEVWIYPEKEPVVVTCTSSGKMTVLTNPDGWKRFPAGTELHLQDGNQVLVRFDQSPGAQGKRSSLGREYFLFLIGTAVPSPTPNPGQSPRYVLKSADPSGAGALFYFFRSVFRYFPV